MAARRLIRSAQSLLSGVYRRVAPSPRGDGGESPGLVLPPTPGTTTSRGRAVASATTPRQDRRCDGADRALVLAGRVLDRRGRPLAEARMEFLQAWPDGAVRGQWTSDAAGEYRFTAGRPDDRHQTQPLLRVRIEHRDAPPLSTALFLPGGRAADRRHPEFHASLRVSVRERSDDLLHARFDFVLDCL